MIIVLCLIALLNGKQTGEVSAKLLVDSGIFWTLAGHSERRQGFGFPGETNEVVGKKAKVALDNGMSVIVCIGEKIEDRENDRTMAICSSQLLALKTELTHSDWTRVVIAYEPVWAIGTGKIYCCTFSAYFSVMNYNDDIDEFFDV